MSGDKESNKDSIRPDLAEVIERHSFGLDERRPEAVARRQQKNQRTARANILDLFDNGRCRYVDSKSSKAATAHKLFVAAERARPRIRRYHGIARHGVLMVNLVRTATKGGP